MIREHKDMECNVHGMAVHRKRTTYNGYVCLQCIQERVKQHRYDRKVELIAMMLGGCWICNESDYEVLDFHHINPDKKSFPLSGNGLCRSLEDQMQEINKCVLLCANCHRRVHHKMPR